MFAPTRAPSARRAYFSDGLKPSYSGYVCLYGFRGSMFRLAVELAVPNFCQITGLYGGFSRRLQLRVGDLTSNQAHNNVVPRGRDEDQSTRVVLTRALLKQLHS